MLFFDRCKISAEIKVDLHNYFSRSFNRYHFLHSKGNSTHAQSPCDWYLYFGWSRGSPTWTTRSSTWPLQKPWHAWEPHVVGHIWRTVQGNWFNPTSRFAEDGLGQVLCLVGLALFNLLHKSNANDFGPRLMEWLADLKNTMSQTLCILIN